MEIQFDASGTPFVVWGNNRIHLEKDPITEKCYIEKAEKELRETPANIETSLTKLRILLKGEPSLVLPIDDDEFLMKFLRPCKFYPESAFKRIQAYYKYRKSYIEYTRDLVPSTVRSAFERSIISFLSPRDQHGRRILLVESECWNPREVSLQELFRGVQLGLEAAMVEPKTQVNGVITILDMKGLTLAQIMQMTPSFAKMVIDWIQDCIPIRLKAVHIINQPYIFNMLFAIFKPFMREKLRSRIYFHGTDRESLRSHIHADALRKRYGGTLPEPEIPGQVVWNMLMHYEDNFKEKNSYGYTATNNNNKK
ncbi:clavesin-2-like [Achroia grisella]|uniref:clavesin-2-like n=1 Tax=Achroia grisella TaxID=688607 RepID=UPI0027D325FC|nr:clavesin-2-like [Achroia grisella]